MATQLSVLGWRIPGTGEPDGIPSMGKKKGFSFSFLHRKASQALSLFASILRDSRQEHNMVLEISYEHRVLG